MKTSSSIRSSGFTLTEIIVSLAVAAAMLAAVVQALVGLGRTRLGGQQRTMAIEETANLMEAIHARAWDQVTESELAAFELSDGFHRVVPRARLTVTVTNIDEPVPAKRIAIEITDADLVDRRHTLSSLTAWKYLREGVAE